MKTQLGRLTSQLEYLKGRDVSKRVAGKEAEVRKDRELLDRLRKVRPRRGTADGADRKGRRRNPLACLFGGGKGLSVRPRRARGACTEPGRRPVSPSPFLRRRRSTSPRRRGSSRSSRGCRRRWWRCSGSWTTSTRSSRRSRQGNGPVVSDPGLGIVSWTHGPSPAPCRGQGSWQRDRCAPYCCYGCWWSLPADVSPVPPRRRRASGLQRRPRRTACWASCRPTWSSCRPRSATPCSRPSSRGSSCRARRQERRPR